jgi:preprotein translocase subunit SecF
MFILNNKKIFLAVSGILVLASLLAIVFFGLRLGIDFKGGAITEIAYTQERPSLDVLNPGLSNLGLGNISIQPAGDLGYLIKSKDLTDVEHSNLLEALSLGGSFSLKETNFNSIGPSVGKELARKAIFSIVLVILVIICFIAFTFRKVSKPVSSWKYGLISIIALLHDIIIPVGVFAVLSHFTSAQVDSLFVVALLTILGLSLSDTIVIFDRVRENLKNNPNNDFEKNVGLSLSQSITRSLNTSITTLIVLFALFIFGPDSTKYFSLMLILGMFFGTYSSIFLASPLLVIANNLQKKQ